MELQQPTKPKRQTQKWEDMSLGAKIVGMVGLAFIALIVIGIIAALISAATHSNSNTSNASNSTPAQSTNSNTQVQAQPTKAQQIATWYDKYGYILNKLGDDMTKIGTDGKNTDATAMNTDCHTLQTDTTTAQDIPAIPDAQSASDLSSGLTYLASAAQDCIDGTANYDASTITKSANEINQANTKLEATAADIRAVKASSQ